MKKTKLLLVFRSDIYREGITVILKREPTITIVAHCFSYLEAEEKANELQPDVVLLDTDLSEGDCVKSIRRVCTLSPQTKVIIFTHSTEGRDLFNAIKAGAVGYLTKYIPSEDLIKTITLVANGEAIIGSPLADKLSAEFSSLESRKSRQGGKFDILTQREREVLEMVATGATNKEIANSLFISEHTVKVHLRNIMAKLHIHNRQQATAMAMQDNLELPVDEEYRE